MGSGGPSGSHRAICHFVGVSAVEDGPIALRVSPNPLGRDRESLELRRLFGADIELVEYPIDGPRDVSSVSDCARKLGVVAVVPTHYRRTAELAREFHPIPVLTTLRREESTVNRHGHPTVIQVWSGLGKVDESGDVEPLDDLALKSFQ
jgi:hypothetical protein